VREEEETETSRITPETGSGRGRKGGETGENPRPEKRFFERQPDFPPGVSPRGDVRDGGVEKRIDRQKRKERGDAEKMIKKREFHLRINLNMNMTKGGKESKN